ncbi:MAG TPA: hypothetical protein VJY41_08455 [Prolixibacteraceae bacterium]|nr:hypothetical protein [Prolixibacteraceae bacterium]
MKARITTTIITIFMIVTNLIAQPLPPSTPHGNSVPLGSFGILLLAAGIVLLFNKRKKHK